MVTAVLVTYNSAGCVGHCLASLVDHLPDAELVVVDNGSSDHTERVVASSTPRARILSLGRNIGFGRACNLGVEAATRESVLILNPDVTVESVDEAALARLLVERPLGLVAPALDGPPRDRLRPERPWLSDFLQHTIGTLRPHEWAAGRVRVPPRNGTDLWVGGAMLLVDRQEFTSLHGFDPRFFLYYEDRDLSRRYRRAGLPIRATGALTGAHVGGASSSQAGLRAVPMAWSLLGWIEFLWIHEGERVARRAARSTIRVLEAIRLGAHGLRALVPRWERLRRKTHQIDNLFDALQAQVEGEGREFCPDALRILSARGNRIAMSGERR